MLGVLFVAAQPAAAVPPPVPVPATILNLVASGCLVERSGTAAPYAPTAFRFRAPAGATLLILLPEANPALTFSLAQGNGRPLVTDAGFGAGDVRITLPAAGDYELQVAGFDAVRRVAVPVTFRIKLALEVEGVRACAAD